MSSSFDTPSDLIWTTNGVVEEIERWCAERTHALGLDCSPAGRQLDDFMKEKVETSGPGMYGFSVTEAPFDNPACRSLLARLIAELAHEIQTSATTLVPRWTFLHYPESPGIYPYWLAILERLHAGIIRSFAKVDAPAPLALDLDALVRAAVDMHRWMPIWRDLRTVRQLGQRARFADPIAELDALDQLIAAARQLPASHHIHLLRDPGLRVLLAARAELLEALGRPAEAAAAWRDVAAVETDADAVAVALEIARQLEPPTPPSPHDK